MCSHPCTGDATAEKITGKNHEKFSELNFLPQNHGLCQNLLPSVAATMRWRRDNLKKKIAPASQAKIYLCSRSFS